MTQLEPYVSGGSDDQTGFSVKESIHAWDRYIPINIQLGTEDTVQDLVNLITEVEERPMAVNLYLNPSFEAALSGITNDGATATQSSTAPEWGTKTLSVAPANSVAEEGSYTEITLGGLDSYLCVSVNVEDNAGSGDDAQIKIQDSNGVDLNASVSVVATATTQRITTQYVLPATPATYRVWMGTVSKHSTPLFFDGLQIEHRRDGKSTPYIDAGIARETSWQGTANASISQRLSPMSVIKGFRLNFDKATLIAFDQEADKRTVTGSEKNVSIAASTTNWDNPWPVDIRTKISFSNFVDTEKPTVTGIVWGRSKI